MSYLSRIQIVSDLHLETPYSNPRYNSCEIRVDSDVLLLLGDIGRTNDDGLYTFLRKVLDQNRECHVLYIIGNHEAYGTTIRDAVQRLRSFESEAIELYNGRFRFLHRDRYDISDSLSFLGCILWSCVLPEQTSDIVLRLKDLNESLGIREWNLTTMQEERARDLDWLNSQVKRIEAEEPERSIVVATHHCPTIDPRASDPTYHGSSVSSAFATDLSDERCWKSKSVKMWAYGHTHFSCCFTDKETGKLVLANQRGYRVANGMRDSVKLKTGI